MPKEKKLKEKEPDEKETKENTEGPKQMIQAELIKERVVTENSNLARDLHNQGRYGKIMANGKVQLSLVEGLYLLEKNKMIVTEGRRKQLNAETFIKKSLKFEPNLWVRYCVYKDIRNRGYIIKTALKFGADFRVYDRGVKPGEDHAKWIVYPVHEASTITWYEFAAKNRVAHSTKKRLLIGIVDDEDDVTYYEIRWVRP
ncbi:tRNA-intron lyase [Candidatus Woesearchaeota archaeon CG10_big_fil_rev_8_21_14_0_10_44_13]|nr:MAG: tRNA-intron lyase [Candidatus Woesearchaeota archaeon CG10_big_fil_rev_8_21_14_0_10_44_13]